MRLVLTAAISVLMLSACAQGPSNNSPQRYALAGHPGVTCLDEGNRPGMHLKAEPLCMTEGQWAALAQRSHLESDLPPFSSQWSGQQQVAADGRPPRGP